MTPRAWIIAGWVLIAAAAVSAIVAVIAVLGSGSAVVCVQLAGVTCPGNRAQLLPALGGTQFLDGIICAVGAGVAFFSALACFFWAAHLRTLHALRALAEAKGAVASSGR